MFSSDQSQVSSAANYIEDVFSTYLYTGNGSTQTITNGIDLAGKGGLVWVKQRSSEATVGRNVVTDTVRGGGNILVTDGNNANQTGTSTGVDSFSSTGFDVGSSSSFSPRTYASWTFRKQAKFFDVVTYTGTGANRTISHNLGSVPGCVIVKRTDTTGNWAVYHRSLTSAAYSMALNTTGAQASAPTMWNSTAPTSTEFSVGTNSYVNASGGTYVAYLFAHDAGGFGLTGTDNVISCGSFTGNTTVNLGYEPQLVLIKRTDSTSNWHILDTMRKWLGTDAASSAAEGGAFLAPNLSDAESNTSYNTNVTPTGFKVDGITGTYIYIAIRRGPMKTPESGTSVYSGISTSAATGTTQTTGFPIDLHIQRLRSGSSWYWMDRLRGVSTTTTEISTPQFQSNSTSAESNAALTRAFNNTGFQVPSWVSPNTDMTYSFQRAPGFFDVVCYTGDGSNPKTITHNLAAVPELMIVKRRNNTGSWLVYSAGIGATNYLVLNATDASTAGGVFNNATPTSSSFQVYGTSLNTNGGTYVAYLFATVPGVSKVGSYTGTGTTQQINCGFTGGARFVLIKRTDSTGDWYVWDSARGIVAGNDPYLLLNSTAAEVTNTDYIDTYSAGFEITSTAPAAINANGGSFIYLAIA